MHGVTRILLSIFSSFPPTHPPPTLGEPLYFRGSYIHEVLVQDLLYLRGMVAATDVVVSGCSAGAVQTFINADKIRSMLPQRMRVTGLPDSGFLVGYEGAGGCQYQESMKSTFQLMNVASSLPRGCLDQFKATGTSVFLGFVFTWVGG